ncbi:MAG: alpha/beta hydrolase [Phocaeicola sp.]
MHWCYGYLCRAGYAINATQTEYRIQAVAGVSTWDVGDSQRNGFARDWSEEQRKQNLRDVAAQRTREARGEEPLLVGYVPMTEDDINEKTSIIQREAYDYYCTPRASHTNSHNRILFSCNDRLAAFNAFDLIETISPRPLLLIVGSEADTIYFSDSVYEKALEPKEIYRVNGATHVDLYDKSPFVEEVAKKLTDFFFLALK